jgi:hypothetical protein
MLLFLSAKSSSIEFQSQDQKCDVSHNAKTSEHNHDITASTEAFPAQPVVADLAEELPVALHASESAHAEYACAVDGEDGSWIDWSGALDWGGSLSRCLDQSY